MAKTTAEKIANKEAQIQKLLNEKKQLIQKDKKAERTARTRRLCSRHGLLEKFMPDLAAITDEQFEMFVKRGINTSYGQKTLAEIMAQTAAKPTAKPIAATKDSDNAPSGNAGGTATAGA